MGADTAPREDPADTLTGAQREAYLVDEAQRQCGAVPGGIVTAVSASAVSAALRHAGHDRAERGTRHSVGRVGFQVFHTADGGVGVIVGYGWTLPAPGTKPGLLAGYAETLRGAGYGVEFYDDGDNDASWLHVTKAVRSDSRADPR